MSDLHIKSTRKLNNQSINTAKKEYGSNELISVIFIFYILWKTPFVSYYMNTYIAMVLLVGVAVLLAFNRTTYIEDTPIILIPTISFLFLDLLENFYSGAAIFNVIWSVFLNIFPIFAGALLVFYKMDSLIKKLVPLLIFTYFITALTTYIGLLSFPDASRVMAADPDAYKSYFIYNIGGFDFIYSLLLIHPLVVCVLKERKKLVFSLIFTAVSALCIFISAYTTAALVFLLSCIAYALPSGKNKSAIKKRISFICIVLFIALIFLPPILNALADWNVLEASSDKIRDIANMLQGKKVENEDTVIRQDVYAKSWQTFTSSIGNIIWGSLLFETGAAGGHSLIFDILACWGLLGFGIILWMLLTFAKTYKRISGLSPVYYYAFLSFLLTVILIILNPAFWSFELGLVIPIVIYYVADIIPKNNIKE